MPRPGLHKCDDCGSVWEEEQLIYPIPNLAERMDPGGPMPSGECPAHWCGALCYPIEEAAEHAAAERVDASSATAKLDAVLTMLDNPERAIPSEVATEPGPAPERELSAAYSGFADADVSLDMDPSAKSHDEPAQEMRVATVETYLSDVLRALDDISKELRGTGSQIVEAIMKGDLTTDHAVYYVRRALDELHNERSTRRELLRSLQGRRRGVRSEPIAEATMNTGTGGGGSGSSGGSGGQGGARSTPAPTTQPTQPSGGESGGTGGTGTGSAPSTDIKDSPTKSGRADETQADRV